jgi:hypothetical protein
MSFRRLVDLAKMRWRVEIMRTSSRKSASGIASKRVPDPSSPPWLHAASALCRQQTCAIIPKRLLSIGLPEHLRQFIDLRRKAIRMFEFAPETHSSLPPIGTSTTI